MVRNVEARSDICVSKGLSNLRCWWDAKFVRGVKRVDADSGGKQLAQILAQRHNRYPAEQLAKVEFRDDPIILSKGSAITFAEMSPFGHRSQIASSRVPMQIWCGWLDATVCDGALSRYATLDNPQQLIMGAFTHDLAFNADPFLPRDQHSLPEPSVEEQNRTMADFFDGLLRPDVSAVTESSIHYYTMGASGTTPKSGRPRDLTPQPDCTLTRTTN